MRTTGRVAQVVLEILDQGTGAIAIPFEMLVSELGKRGLHPEKTALFHVLQRFIRKGEIVLQSHPLSPVQPRILKHPQEAEVIGQVVGVAMRLADWYPATQPQQQATPELTEGEPKEVRRR